MTIVQTMLIVLGLHPRNPHHVLTGEHLPISTDPNRTLLHAPDTALAMSTHLRRPHARFQNPLEPTKGYLLLATNTADITLTVNLLAAIALEVVLPPEIVHLILNLLLVAELR